MPLLSRRADLVERFYDSGAHQPSGIHPISPPSDGHRPTTEHPNDARRAIQVERVKSEFQPASPAPAPRRARSARSARSLLPPELVARATVDSLIRRCSHSRNPIQAFTRASSKVAFLAGAGGDRAHLRDLVSVLDQHKLAILARERGNEHAASAHLHDGSIALRHFFDRVRDRVRTEQNLDGERRGLTSRAASPAREEGSRLALSERREAAFTAARRERDRFKRDVNLLAYAASRGYAFNKAKTSVNFPALRHPNTGHKILVGKGQDGHWLYYSVNRDDRGSIIDFIQNLEGGKDAFPITKVLQELRDWTNTPRELPVFARAPVHHIPKDRAAVAATVAHGVQVVSHRYLESRGLSADTLQHPRFRSTWLQSGPRRHAHDLPPGTVMFLHHDAEGLCGFETKNWRFTGFARGGTKALWHSWNLSTDSRLVITESALDAISYHQVNPHPKTRYVSFAGALNDGQPALLARAISWMPNGSVIVAATDNDKDGNKFADIIATLASKYPHVSFERHVPTHEKDWNDQLQAFRDRGLQTPAVKARGRER